MKDIHWNCWLHSKRPLSGRSGTGLVVCYLWHCPWKLTLHSSTVRGLAGLYLIPRLLESEPGCRQTSVVTSLCTFWWPVVDNLYTTISCQLWSSFKEKIPAGSVQVVLSKPRFCKGRSWKKENLRMDVLLNPRVRDPVVPAPLKATRQSSLPPFFIIRSLKRVFAFEALTEMLKSSSESIGFAQVVKNGGTPPGSHLPQRDGWGPAAPLIAILFFWFILFHNWHTGQASFPILS